MELSAVAAAVVIAAVAAVRICDHIGRARARAERGHKVVILRRLRSRQLRRKELLVLLGNLRVLCSQFLRRQSLVNAAEAAVHRVDDVARGVLHGVAGVACLRREVVVDILDCFTGIAAIMLSQRLFILCFSRFPREFRLYLHPPLWVGVGHSCQDYWIPSSPVSR